MENKDFTLHNIDELSDLETLVDTHIQINNSNNKIDCDELILIEPISIEIKSEIIEKENSVQKKLSTSQISKSVDNIGEQQKSIISKIFSGMWFGFRYILTTSLIFGVLLVTTNYEAYYNIAMSYINSEALENKSRGLISSVEASNITSRIQNEILEQQGIIEDEKEQIKSKNNIKHLLDISDKNWDGLDIEITPYQNRIIIPKIGKNIPLLDVKNRALDDANELNNIFMKELENGVIRYPGSGIPGKDGNAFVFGHSSNFPWIKGDYNDVFALLDNVSFDDEIIVYYNQKKYRYIVREKNVITPGDVSILERNKSKSEITLMTCWPIGTTLNRLIVTGELVEEL